jgi:uncharacterized membrane protein (UPF0127 family)
MEYACVRGDRGDVVANNVYLARTFWQRLCGLLALPRLESGSGLWLEPCASVHTLGLSYPIDVVFVDGTGRIGRIAHAVAPWRVALAPVRCCAVLEIPAGAASEQGLAAGNKLRLAPEPISDPVTVEGDDE